MMSGDSENMALAPYYFDPEFTENEIKELSSKMSECSNGGRDPNMLDYRPTTKKQHLIITL